MSKWTKNEDELLKLRYPYVLFWKDLLLHFPLRTRPAIQSRARKLGLVRLITSVDLFISKVIKTKTCWNWNGYISSNGYGKFEFNSKKIYAHRFSYEYFKGKIPSGLTIHHICSNKRCVNPFHLEAMSMGDNLRQLDHPDGLKKLQTHCKWGHEFTKENTYVKLNGSRRCRTCHRINMRKTNV